MEVLRSIWLFIQDHVLGMKWLNAVIENVLSAVGLGSSIIRDTNIASQNVAIRNGMILIAVMNTKQIYHDWNADYYYNVVHTCGGKSKASECIKCGKCEKACPQHLHIRDLLVDVAKEFEKLLFTPMPSTCCLVWAKEQGLPSIRPLPQAISNGLDAVTFHSTACILAGV